MANTATLTTTPLPVQAWTINQHDGKHRNVNDDTLPVQSWTINQHDGKRRNVNDDISHDISSPGYNLVLIIELGIPVI
jgi:hypothetical protein